MMSLQRILFPACLWIIDYRIDVESDKKLIVEKLDWIGEADCCLKGSVKNNGGMTIKKLIF